MFRLSGSVGAPLLIPGAAILGYVIVDVSEWLSVRRKEGKERGFAEDTLYPPEAKIIREFSKAYREQLSDDEYRELSESFLAAFEKANQIPELKSNSEAYAQYVAESVARSFNEVVGQRQNREAPL